MKPEDRKQIALIEHCANRIHKKAEQACKYCYDKFGVENSPDGLLEDIAEMALSIRIQAGNLCASRDAQPAVAQEPVAFVNDKCAIQATLHGAITLKPGDNLYTEAPAVAVNEQKDCYDVLLAVKEQFDRFGDRFPDGFDSRVFRWVDDAIAAAQDSRKGWV